MVRPPKFGSEEKLRIVLSVVRGESSIKETARRERVSETSIAKWRVLFVQGGAQALADEARRGPSEREVELERRLEQVTSARGGARGVAAAAARGRERGPFPELELIRAGAGLPIGRFCELAGISRASYYRWRDAAERGTEQRSWPAPVRDRVGQAAAQLALEWPAWGHPQDLGAA